MKKLSLFFCILSFLSINANAFPLTGIWNTKCLKQASGYFQMTSIKIEKDLWTQTIWWAEDYLCEKIILENQSLFQFKVSEGNWDGKNLMQYIRPYTKTMAANFNETKLCGMNNWKHGRMTEVTGQSCLGFNTLNYDQILYSAYKVEGPKNNLLWIGIASDTNTGLTEQTRHNLLSDDILVRDPESFK
jgi:hypothetical protein